MTVLNWTINSLLGKCKDMCDDLVNNITNSQIEDYHYFYEAGLDWTGVQPVVSVDV